MVSRFYKIFRWWPTIVVFIAILWLTLAPHPLPDNDIRMFEGADKIVHAIMFGALTFAALFDISKWSLRLNLTTILSVCAGILIFAFLDEAAQSYMNLGRTGDLYDFIADALGILIVASGIFIFKKVYGIF